MNFSDNHLLWVAPCVFQKQQVLSNALGHLGSMYSRGGAWECRAQGEQPPQGGTEPSQGTRLQTPEKFYYRTGG